MSYIHSPIEQCPPWLLVPQNAFIKSSHKDTYNNVDNVIEKLKINLPYTGAHIKVARDFVKSITHEYKLISIVFRNDDDFIVLECTGYHWEYTV